MRETLFLRPHLRGPGTLPLWKRPAEVALRTTGGEVEVAVVRVVDLRCEEHLM